MSYNDIIILGQKLEDKYGTGNFISTPHPTHLPHTVRLPSTHTTFTGSPHTTISPRVPTTTPHSIPKITIDPHSNIRNEYGKYIKDGKLTNHAKSEGFNSINEVNKSFREAVPKAGVEKRKIYIDNKKTEKFLDRQVKSFEAYSKGRIQGLIHEMKSPKVWLTVVGTAIGLCYLLTGKAPSKSGNAEVDKLNNEISNIDSFNHNQIGKLSEAIESCNESLNELSSTLSDNDKKKIHGITSKLDEAKNILNELSQAIALNPANKSEIKLMAYNTKKIQTICNTLAPHIEKAVPIFSRAGYNDQASKLEDVGILLKTISLAISNAGK